MSDQKPELNAGSRTSQDKFEKAYAKEASEIYLDMTTRAIFGRGWDAAIAADRSNSENPLRKELEQELTAYIDVQLGVLRNTYGKLDGGKVAGARWLAETIKDFWRASHA